MHSAYKRKRYILLVQAELRLRIPIIDFISLEYCQKLSEILLFQHALLVKYSSSNW